MHTNKIWLGFLLFITSCVVWGSYEAVTKIVKYLEYTDSVPPLHLTIEPVEIDRDLYHLKVAYTFSFENRMYSAEEVVAGTAYGTRKSAEAAAVKKQAKEPFAVQFSPQNPQMSTLFKKFPMKEAVYAAILWFLWAYFVRLGFYAARYGQ